MVRSIEGKGGGFQLAKAAEHITVLDVANAIDGDKRIFECREIRQRLAVFEEQPPQWACEGICGVRSVMDMAQQRMEEALGQHTILDLARKMYRKAPDTLWLKCRTGLPREKRSRRNRPIAQGSSGARKEGRIRH